MSDVLARFEARDVGEGRRVLSVVGEVDLTNAEAFERALAEAIADAVSVTLDLSGAGYLDSHALRVIQQLADRHLRTGLEVAVVAPTGSVAASLLAVTALGRQVPVVEHI